MYLKKIPIGTFFNRSSRVRFVEVEAGSLVTSLVYHPAKISPVTRGHRWSNWRLCSDNILVPIIHTCTYVPPDLYTNRNIYPPDIDRLTIDVKLNVEPDFSISSPVQNTLGLVIHMWMEVPQNVKN